MTPGNTHRRSGNTGETKPFVGNSSDDHSGPSESQDPESHVNQISAKATITSGSLPQSFIDRLLKLSCTECHKPFSSRDDNTHPFFAYCDIVCGQCAKKSEFTGTRCEKCESHFPDNIFQADFKRYDAFFDLYTIIETADSGYRCTKCHKLNPLENTVRCIDTNKHVDDDGVRSKEIDHVVCVWCARDHHKGHSRVFLEAMIDQPSIVDNEFISSFAPSCIKPYFLIHCASCGSILCNNDPKEKPSAITISCGHLVGTNLDVCCNAFKKEPTAEIYCIFCKTSVEKGYELHHFKYLKDFLGEFEPDENCIGGCGLRHSTKNCEEPNKCIWCTIKNGQ